jgi:hypothetical protein
LLVLHADAALARHPEVQSGAFLGSLRDGRHELATSVALTEEPAVTQSNYRRRTVTHTENKLILDGPDTDR